MCRRFSLDLDWNAVGRQFGIDDEDIDAQTLPTRTFRVEPEQKIGVIAADSRNERHLRGGSWSLIPSWSKSSKLAYPTYNARMESAGEKPTFRDSMHSCRAIIPAEGYFEFKHDKPFYFHSSENSTLAMAWLYSWWRQNEFSPWLLTATIMTCEAIGGLAEIHNRMPLLVSESRTEEWLDRTIGGSEIISEIHNESLSISENLDYYEVAEPQPGEDGPQCIRPVTNVAPLSLF
ncbi:SOS response-associated peptidase [Bifidobacterium sp. ESL0732]|uniref:SOS response-associated peptidase n=1 Tax=Bifidobacterium sp. ESL0732 TaxID=2983222 RepID=UPI0023F63F07|nr:SOS response-associated peptidase [Bifidobacterium sp. ESL0732]WEV63328.1 SOS response-associated peptidase [Bifidobacterium sp. ESL0732]